MKIKQIPEDFLVEEIPSIKISEKKDNYIIFLLEKRGLEIFHVLRCIGKKLKIPVKEIGYSGLKDKHAITKQYISLPKKYLSKNNESKIISEKNLVLKKIGYSNEKIKIGELKGNKFIICVRDIKEEELEKINLNADIVKKFGVPNYYDAQRFGSSFKGEFVAKYLIKKDYETALRIFLQPRRKEKKEIKKIKKFINENWLNCCKIKKFLEEEKFKNREIERIINFLSKNPKDFLGAFKLIRKNLQSLFISAYQSYLWNECAKEYLKEIINEKNLYSAKYFQKSFLFYKKLTKEEFEKLKSLKLKTISDNLVFNDDKEKEIINKILFREGLTLRDFKIREETDLFFKAREREILSLPKNFSVSEPEIDELNYKEKGLRKKFKIFLSFELPKGSYATIVIKRIFS